MSLFLLGKKGTLIEIRKDDYNFSLNNRQYRYIEYI